jgi:hypothetical protein
MQRLEPLHTLNVFLAAEAGRGSLLRGRTKKYL